jgi:hypothetical protein
MAKGKSHPQDSLTFDAPKLDEASAQQAVHETPAPSAKVVESTITTEEETRASNVTLPARIWESIDAKHAEARSKGGKPLRKAAIIRAVFEVVMAANVDLAGTQSEQELVERLKRANTQ